MAAPKELRTVERISPEEQKLDLQKGLGIGKQLIGTSEGKGKEA